MIFELLNKNDSIICISYSIKKEKRFEYPEINNGQVPISEPDDGLEVPAALLDDGDGLAEGGREECAERSLDVRLARLPVTLVVHAASAVKRARPRGIQGNETKLKIIFKKGFGRIIVIGQEK
jgi:hypothetical protein